MSQELCPQCGRLREMKTSPSKRKELDANGNPQEVVTISYHCATCHTFVRSEDVEQSNK